MTAKDLLNQKKGDFDKAIEFYKTEIASIRTGRATTSLAEDIQAEYYGQRLMIKELASLSVPEPRTLLIQPWDKGALEAIAGGIRKSEIGLNPVVDGQSVRLNIPALTEERRKEFIKSLKQKTEESKIKIRRIREEIWDKVQKMEKEGEIREDEKFKARDELQKLIDSYNHKLEELESKKESELTS